MLETTRNRFFRKGDTWHRTPLIMFLSCCMSVYLSGCATTYPANPPLQQSDPTAGYEYANVAEASGKNSEVLLLLAFSGGGTRAAAFSYGVLKELNGIELDREGHKYSLG